MKPEAYSMEHSTRSSPTSESSTWGDIVSLCKLVREVSEFEKKLRL